MRLTPLKYLFVFLLPFSVIFSFYSEGIWAYSAVIFAFGLVPLSELLIPPDPSNRDRQLIKKIQDQRIYDVLIYSIVPIQLVTVYLFLESVSGPLSTVTLVGRIAALGLSCGVLGINVGHELGHRLTKYERNMAKTLLMTSLYMHFYIEHNKGHHRNIGTEKDPATARRGEWLMQFWVRSIIGVYRNAWSIANQESRKKQGKALSIRNEMIGFSLIQITWTGLIFLFYGFEVGLYYLAASAIGYLLLETVEYIEHYGLRRKRVSEHRYENTQPKHSWNSDHILGRLILFELSRHSDHHFQPHKKYQILDHHDSSPQMPTGYPGMMLLATVPPLWFKVMNPKVDQWSSPEP